MREAEIEPAIRLAGGHAEQPAGRADPLDRLRHAIEQRLGDEARAAPLLEGALILLRHRAVQIGRAGRMQHRDRLDEAQPHDAAGGGGARIGQAGGEEAIGHRFADRLLAIDEGAVAIEEGEAVSHRSDTCPGMRYRGS